MTARKPDAERESINTRGALSKAASVATITRHMTALVEKHPAEIETIRLAINRADIAGYREGQRDVLEADL